MTATFDQANGEILTIFKDAWDPTGHLALYENVQGDRPTAQSPYARISVRHGPPGPTSLTGSLGTHRFERTGLLTVQIFIPNGQGLSLGYVLGKIVADAFEGVASPLQVWFRNIRVNEVGPSDEWFQFNVLVDFTYDEIK